MDTIKTSACIGQCAKMIQAVFHDGNDGLPMNAPPCELSHIRHSVSDFKVSISSSFCRMATVSFGYCHLCPSLVRCGGFLAGSLPEYMQHVKGSGTAAERR